MRVTRVVLALLMSAVPAFAGTIFGTLKVNGEPVGSGVQVLVTCRGEQYYGKTDQYGAYNVGVPPGRCELAVNFNKSWTEPYAIASSDDPARYDFELVYQDGRYVLKRR
jgi:hypothetical protein